MIDFVILHSEEVPIHLKIFHSVYIFFPEVIGICNINCDTDESFEISIEFQCDIFKRVSVFLLQVPYIIFRKKFSGLVHTVPTIKAMSIM